MNNINAYSRTQLYGSIFRFFYADLTLLKAKTGFEYSSVSALGSIYITIYVAHFMSRLVCCLNLGTFDCNLALIVESNPPLFSSNHPLFISVFPSI